MVGWHSKKALGSRAYGSHMDRRSVSGVDDRVRWGDEDHPLVKSMMRILNRAIIYLSIVRPIAEITVVVGLAMMAYFLMFDREAPFAVLGVEPAEAKPGEWVSVTAHVKRDLKRKCSVDFSRNIIDKSGLMYVLQSRSSASDDMIRQMDARKPGKLVLSFLVPPTASYGEADIVSVLEYQCNPMQRWRPIEMTTVIPFTILPP